LTSSASAASRSGQRQRRHSRAAAPEAPSAEALDLVGRQVQRDRLGAGQRSHRVQRGRWLRRQGQAQAVELVAAHGQFKTGVVGLQAGGHRAGLERQAQLRRHRRHAVRALGDQRLDQHLEPGALHHGHRAQAVGAIAGRGQHAVGHIAQHVFFYQRRQRRLQARRRQRRGFHAQQGDVGRGQQQGHAARGRHHGAQVAQRCVALLLHGAAVSHQRKCAGLRGAAVDAGLGRVADK